MLPFVRGGGVVCRRFVNSYQSLIYVAFIKKYDIALGGCNSTGILTFAACLSKSYALTRSDILFDMATNVFCALFVFLVLPLAPLALAKGVCRSCK